MTTPLDFEHFIVGDNENGVILVTLNRPEKLNAMNRQWFTELRQLMALLDADPECRVAIITGAGRAFSAGGDIESFDELTDIRRARDHLRLVFDSFDSIARSSTVVIAAVNGIAYGGGTELTLACDLAIASSEALFGFKESTHNLIPGFGLVRGPAVIGRTWTQRLAMSAETLDARTACGIGLVHEVVEADDLITRATAIASSIAANGPLAVETAKAFMHRHHRSGIAEVTEATALLFATDDHRSARSAFLHGTEKRFRGT